MPIPGAYGDIVRVKHVGEDPEPRRRPEFEAAIMDKGPGWSGCSGISEPITRLDLERRGQPEWDNNDYSRDFTWLGQPRLPVESQYTPLDVRKSRAREAGLIVCDCVWVDDRLVVWVPWCQAHGGGCSACGHRHVRLEGVDGRSGTRHRV